MNNSLPPVPVSDPTKSTIQVIGSNRSSHKKTLIIIASSILLLAGIATAVYLIGFRQYFSSQACDCTTYKFNVSSDGQVTAINGSNRDEPSQKVSISINNAPTAILDVPALRAGASASIGQVVVPITHEFNWDAIGTFACSNHGSYTGTSPTPTIPLPSPTVPAASPSPTLPVTTPSVTPVMPPPPTVTPYPSSPITPTATVVPTTPVLPSVTPSPTVPAPTPTTPPVVYNSGPNSCGGTCGSDANCEDTLTCFNGLCRRPACPNSESCACPPGPSNNTASAPVTPTPVASLPQTGATENTFLLSAGSLVLIGLGILLAF